MHRRAGAFAVGIAAAAGLLAACDKPAPRVTVYGSRTVINVSASDYCFDSTHCRVQRLSLPVIDVAADDKILVEVPRKLVGKGWQLRALDPSNSNKEIGTSGEIADSHSYKLTSGLAGGQPFIVEVNQLAGGKPDGSTWSFIVKVSPTKS